MKLKMFAAAIALMVAMPAIAHEPKPRHGGRVVEAGSFHVEMVAQDTALSIHLVDHDDKAVAVKGYKGVAIFSVGGKSERVVLAPSEDAKLMSGKATVALPKQPKGVVQITPPNGKVIRARFD
jgi:hypothetical protein